MGIRTQHHSRYVFNTPYHRDTRLVAKPLYSTTHEMTYPYHETGRYGHVTSKYKQQAPFIKPDTRIIHHRLSRSVFLTN